MIVWHFAMRKKGIAKLLDPNPILSTAWFFVKGVEIQMAQGFPDNPKNLASAQKQTYNRQ
jgi:hypothetical protein